METKKCTQCKVMRTINHYVGKKVKYTTICDICINIKKKHKNKKKDLNIEIIDNEIKCNSCYNVKNIDQFKSKTNNEIVKTCLYCRNIKNKHKHKRFGWNDIEISKAKKEFDIKYKFFVLKPIISWALKQPYKKCTHCKKSCNFDQFISNRYEFTEVNTCLKCRMNKEINRNNINNVTNNLNYLKKLKNNIRELKIKKGPCIDCGESDIKVLEFDHIDETNKINEITNLRSLETMNSESDKCQIRCRICHIIKSVNNFLFDFFLFLICSKVIILWQFAHKN